MCTTQDITISKHNLSVKLTKAMQNNIKICEKTPRERDTKPEKVSYVAR